MIFMFMFYLIVVIIMNLLPGEAINLLLWMFDASQAIIRILSRLSII